MAWENIRTINYLLGDNAVGKPPEAEQSAVLCDLGLNYKDTLVLAQ